MTVRPRFILSPPFTIFERPVPGRPDHASAPFEDLQGVAFLHHLAQGRGIGHHRGGQDSHPVREQRREKERAGTHRDDEDEDEVLFGQNVFAGRVGQIARPSGVFRTGLTAAIPSVASMKFKKDLIHPAIRRNDMPPNSPAKGRSRRPSRGVMASPTARDRTRVHETPIRHSSATRSAGTAPISSS